MKPLRLHQSDALAFLRRKAWRGALFMEPGLGKTRVGLELAATAGRTLVIAPLNPMLFVWPDQQREWFPKASFAVARGTPKQRADILFNQKHDIVVINYELMRWFYDEVRTRRKLPYDLCIIDESTYVKNHNGIAFRALAALLHAFDAAIPMTGTPAENSLTDLWGQLYMVDQGDALGKKIGVFRERYCRAVRRENYVKWEVARPAELRAAAAPLCFVRRATDCLDMPPLSFQDVKFSLTTQERDAYRKVIQEKIVPLPKPVPIENTGVAFDKARQVTSGFVYDETRFAYPIGTSKARALLEAIGECFGSPVLIGFWFQGSKQTIVRALGYTPPAIDRHTGTQDKAAILKRWSAGEIPVLLGQIKTVALGLNMQSPSASIIFFDLPWSHGLHWQFIQRVWRQGQATRVVVRRLIAAGTIDTYVARVLASKEQNETDFLNAVLNLELS